MSEEKDIKKLPEYWRKEDAGRDSLRGKMSEQDFARVLRTLFDSARDAHKAEAQRWKKYDRWYRGKQWERAFEPWRAQLVINACFSVVETQLPVLADVDPRMTMMPVEGGDKATADGLDELIRYNFAKHFWDIEFVLAQKTALKLGTAVLKVGWDPDLGLAGDVSLSRVPPYCFFPDPTARTLEECRYIFEAKVMSLSEVKRLHPKKADKLEKSSVALGAEEAREAPDTDKLPYPGGEGSLFSEGLSPREIDMLHETSGVRDMLTKVLYVECWISDDTMTELLEEDGKPVVDDDGEPVRVKRYPGGRHICFVGDVILCDEPNPFHHGKWPYVMLYNYPDDEGIWGISEIENIMDMQKLLNKTESQITDNANLMGNPNWIVDDNSGVITDTISNQPGKVIKKRQGSEVRRDHPPELPQYLQNQHDKAIADIEYVTGVHDVLQGKRPEGLRTYSAIRQVLEIGERRIRLKVLFQLAAMRKMARLVAACYMQFYDTSRWERILGEERVADILRSRIASGLNTREEKGEDVKVEDELVFNLEEIYEMYDFYSETESMTRNTRELMKEQMKDLYQLGAIDQIALLKSWQVDGWEEIVERMTGKSPAGTGEKAEEKKEAPPPEENPLTEELLNMMAQGAQGAPPVMPPLEPYEPYAVQ